jgi:hypothetical protein
VHDPAVAHDPSDLTQRQHPVVALVQVVDRAEQQVGWPARAVS